MDIKENNNNLNSENKPNNNIEVIKITKIREIIAQKMVVSSTEIPTATLMDEIDVTDLISLRKEKKEELDSQGIKLTYMSFIAKATTIALKEIPLFNASFDAAKKEINIKKFINLGIAVDTNRGLIVPNIKNADQLNIIELAKEIQKIAQNAKEEKLTLSQIQNGTFTISNFGSIGGLQCTPIINIPELAILGVGKIVKKPIVKDDQIVIGNVLHLSLSYDHRIIDGADAARFLNKIISLLNDVSKLEKYIS
ncbi:dihydrolipoamide acetyltransferase family protein ['Camptotheca acuminata' phytoplasma]|uniref:dihydrolipoamide acetyltransferase family protein n=1 Tax='Camptotheca acuminata' phytoplasma TaxID=3239192 RepID=UPI00351A6291